MPLTPISYPFDDTAQSPPRWTGLGRNLTGQEASYDLYNHDTRIAALEADVTVNVSIDDITQPTDDTLLVVMTDASTRGPFMLPIAGLRFRGEWAPDTGYLVNDMVTANGALYRVPFAHTSGSSFDPGANDGAGHDYYEQWLALPANSLPAGGAPRMNLKKSTSADYVMTWGFDAASDVTFSPSTGSTLISDNVADALEELDSKIASGEGVDAAHVAFAPSTGSWLTATNVDDALDELSAINAIHVGFTPPTASSLTATDVADALVELEGLIGTGGGGSFLPLSGGTMTGAITLAADPSTSLQAATKQYVDGIATNLGKRGRVRVLDSSNSDPATSGYTNGATIDGVTLATGDLVLRNSASNAARNGVWVVASSGGASRFTDYAAYDDHPGSLIAVEEGTASADTIWLCTSNAGGTLDTTAINFNQATASGALLAANNLSDLANAATARSNLGLGTAATHATTDFLSAAISSPVTGQLAIYNGTTFVNKSAIDLPCHTISGASGAVTVDRNDGETQVINVTGNITGITVNNWGGSGQLSKLTMIIKNSGAFAVVLPAAKWAGGTPPTITSGTATDILTFVTPDGGTTLYGNTIGQAYS
jgi:hypothetical protein